MDFQIEHAVEILNKTPHVLDLMLRDLPQEWTHRNEGEDTWSAFDILGHLIHGEETDWVPRARCILEFGEDKTFEPFDRFAQMEKSKGKSLDEQLDTFKRLRAENLQVLSDLEITPSLLRLTGKHPEFGVVTMSELLSTWVVHDLSHVAHIARVMSRQYKETTGPWKAYLPILGG